MLTLPTMSLLITILILQLQIFTSITNFHVNSSYNEFVNHNTYLTITDLHFHGGPRSPTKDKYIDLEEKNDIHLHGGHDTPEPSKPKKVIYEVVV